MRVSQIVGMYSCRVFNVRSTVPLTVLNKPVGQRGGLCLSTGQVEEICCARTDAAVRCGRSVEERSWLGWLMLEDKQLIDYIVFVIYTRTPLPGLLARLAHCAKRHPGMELRRC